MRMAGVRLAKPFIRLQKASNAGGALDTMLMKFIAAAAVLAGVAVPTEAQPPEVYIMRHLQKADASRDPVLSQEGAVNANSVAELLAARGIKAVFATKTRRAELSAAPLAARLGISVTHYDPSDVPALIAAVRAITGNVLIVGHSNTVPDLVAAFGGAKPAPLTEQDYGIIYQVTPGSSEVRQFQVPAAGALTGPERGR
jgi:phosphohistidine phosphatase SixA